MPHPLRFESKKRRICVAWVWNREETEKLVNGKQHSVFFLPTGMKGLPQNVILNFRLEFLKSDLTIYLPSGISKIFCQMVSTPALFLFVNSGCSVMRNSIKGSIGGNVAGTPAAYCYIQLSTEIPTGLLSMY